jgi:hypothetical protein
MTDVELDRLLAEGRKHDEAMTPGPWFGRHRLVSTVPDSRGMGGTLHTNHIANTADPEEAAGVAWMRTNLCTLLDELDRLRDEIESRDQDAMERAL